MASGELRLVYTVAEAAELLGIGRSTAYEYVASGDLATSRIGSRLVVTRPTLTELLGVEPPLPAELDAARAALAAPRPPAPPVPRRRARTSEAQARLPFSA